MKLKLNKTTIVILIVAAVAVYLLWKRHKESAAADTGDSSTAASDPTSLDYILENITFTSAERAKILALKKKADNDASYRQKIQDKADATGRSFDQQLVLDAIWVLYHSDSGWVDGTGSASEYGWKLQQKVLQLAGQSLW